MVMDFNKFLKQVKDAAPDGTTPKAAETIARAMSETDPKAERVIKAEVKANAKPIKLALRRKKGDAFFNEIIIGDKKILNENIDSLKNLISADLLEI